MKWMICIAVFVWSVSAQAQQAVSPFNGIELNDDTTDATGHFIVSAHFYGGSHNKAGFPASTLLGNLGNINRSDADAVFCCGDLFKDVRNDIPRYEFALFQQLQKPLFNAPGNHDISGDVYTENFGSTYSAFDWNDDRFILLDSELDDSNISGEQLDFLQTQLAGAGQVRHIFIFSHRPIWAEEDEVLSNFFRFNTRGTGSVNFNEEVRPLLDQAQEKAPIYWFSGSMGDVPVSYFYQQEENQQLHFIQTAIRDLERDAILHVKSNDQGVQFETESIVGDEVEPLETYDATYWSDFRKPTEFNYRLIPFWLRTMFTHRFFWYGVGYTLFILLIIRWWVRRRKRKRA